MANQQYKFKSQNKAELTTIFNKDGSMDSMLNSEMTFTIDEDIFNSYHQTIGLEHNDSIWPIYKSDLILANEPTNLVNMLEPEEDTSEPQEIWSEQETKTLFLKDHLAEAIRARYAFLNRPAAGLSNVVIDSFFPRLMYKAKLDTRLLTEQYANSMPSTAVAISPLVASILRVKQADPEQLCRILGYDKKKLKQLMNAVKSKQYTFAFIGAGGTGVNTLHWLSEISKFTNTVGLFKCVHVYDNDTIEVSNLLRFPKHLGAINHTLYEYTPRKINIIEADATRLSKNIPVLSTQLIAEETNGDSYYNYQSSYPFELFKHIKNDDSTYTFTTKPNIILYGAPDIESRQRLSACGSFISATHASLNCHMYLNPHQDEAIQIESYGMIQLAPFFMNQLKMAITLLEYIGQDNLDLSEPDKEILNFQFDGTLNLPTDRQYNFQIEKEVLMLTEQESEDI